MPAPTEPLTTLDAVRGFLAESRQPVFYVSRTATHLIGVERWVGGLSFIAVADSWDGAHPRVFTPRRRPPARALRSNTAAVRWLLGSREVQRHIAASTPEGMRPQIVLAFFDEAAERLCRQLGYELIMPTVALRERLDSKMVTTRLGNEVGIASVPNILTRVRSWGDLREQAEAAGLGSDLVVQTAYGQSGSTTYFITDEAGYQAVAARITGVEVKVMRRINHRPLAYEAVVTRSGTVVGPGMTEVTGHPELTPYRGGWAGNEVYPGLLEAERREAAVHLVRTLGDRMAQEGYRGIFEVDVLVDTDTGEVYLGELNPRIAGTAAISNAVSARMLGLPLFAFHVLEHSAADFQLDVEAINAQQASADAVQAWSSMLIQHGDATVERITQAPRSGRYRRRDDGVLELIESGHDWYDLDADDEAFFLRVLDRGDVRSTGSDLGMLIARVRLQSAQRELEPVARELITGIKSHCTATPLSGPVRWRSALLSRLRPFVSRLRGR